MNDAMIEIMNKYSVIDLSHPLEQDMPVWPTHPRFFQNEIESYHRGDDSYLNQLTLGEHCGTHVDAPIHFVAGGKSIDEVDVLQLFGQALKIDMSGVPANGTLGREGIERWEQENREIQPGDIVLFYSGYEHRWALRPNQQPFLCDWPGLSREAAAYLVAKGIKAVGTDVMTIDAFVHDGYPAHDVFLNNEVLIIENLTNLQQLPAQFIFMALPLKIKHGSASPIRAIALLEH